MATRFLKISSNGNKILKSKLMTAPSYMIIFNFSFPFSTELFKILTAIAEEIEILRQSTEQRFQALETLVQHNKNNIYGALIPTATAAAAAASAPPVSSSSVANGKARSDCSSQLRGSSDQEVESAPTRPASWPRGPPPPQVRQP